ncbi:MAG: hypothetical protein P8M25_07670, partial [Paracoccaceae bacterium]|nr:hypothetical protein [Paracoccaceae bacterium]
MQELKHLPKTGFSRCMQARALFDKQNGFQDSARKAGKTPLAYRAARSDRQPTTVAGIWLNLDLD